jgi:hypothetical protein
VVGQGERFDERGELDRAAGEVAAEAGGPGPVRGRPEGWYAIHGGMVAARGNLPGGSWTNLDAIALVGGLSSCVPVGTFAGC